MTTTEARISPTTEHSDTAAAQHFIGGQWTSSATVGTSIDPSTGDILGSYHDGGAQEAQAAIDAARSSFDTSTWSLDAKARAQALLALADRID